MVINSAVVCLFALAAAASASNIEQCPGTNIAGLSEAVHMTCKRTPCVLKRNSDQHINIKFTPDKDMKDVINSVNAFVFGVPLPFFGVDGKSICEKIFTEDDVKVGCPLKAGTTYVYKDSFPVLPQYPPIEVRVHWALENSADQSDIICFEVPARIK